MATTDSRQLRILIDEMLSAYGIDNAELSFKLTDGIKRMIGNPTPARTREEIMASIQKSLTGGAAKQEQLSRIESEIHSRTHINPVTRDWQDFIEWAWKKNEKEGESITAFLDWWLADEWQATHPPTKPEAWMVKWNMAFVLTPKQIRQQFDPYASLDIYLAEQTQIGAA